MRSPALWVIGLLGILSVWAGSNLDVLAIGGLGHAAELGWSTAEGVAILAAIIVVTRTLAEDRTTGLSATVAAGPLGEFGHVLGRWAGGALVGASCSVPPIISSVVLSNHIHFVSGDSLHYAPIYPAVSLFAEILHSWHSLTVHRG